MMQISRPQPGRLITYPDAGPYTAQQWADLLSITHIGDEKTTRGPFAWYLNALEVTEAPADTVAINTGAALCNGHLLINDAAVAITPTAPGALTTRQDRVVVVQNNTNVAYNTNLDTPAPYAAGVPAYSTRLAVLRGDPAVDPNPRALVQSASYWMVELAQYSITGAAGTISGMTDYRDYVDAEMKYLFIPCIHAYDVTAAAEIYCTVTVNYGQPAYNLTGSNLSYSYGRWRVPADFISSLNIQGVCFGELAGPDIYCANNYSSGTCGGAQNTNEQLGAYAAEALDATRTDYSCHASLDILAANIGNIGDLVRLVFARDATNILDTLGATSLKFIGFRLQYLGYRR